MRMAEADRIISDGIKSRGYRVSFEKVDGRFLVSDYFPDREEPMIENEEEAWILASKFASATFGKCINIYVVDDHYRPVSGYDRRMIHNR